VKYVGLTLRVEEQAYAQGSERRDALDQRWIPFLAACGLLPVLLPNQVEASLFLLENLPLAGLILSGGNTLGAYGGTAPERDATETALLESACQRALPVLGVCRGLQGLHHHFGGILSPVAHPIGIPHTLRSGRSVNSYHRYGFTAVTADFEALEIAEDGVIEAMRHKTLPLCGIMWHPERVSPREESDIVLFRKHFNV
jgi:putative glutamine amidotransferase